MEKDIRNFKIKSELCRISVYTMLVIMIFQAELGIGWSIFWVILSAIGTYILNRILIDFQIFIWEDQAKARQRLLEREEQNKKLEKFKETIEEIIDEQKNK